MKRTIKCPVCRKDVPLDSPEMPFCSERCRLIDLGRWANEEYRIPGEPVSRPQPPPEDADDKEA